MHEKEEIDRKQNFITKSNWHIITIKYINIIYKCIIHDRGLSKVSTNTRHILNLTIACLNTVDD